MLLHSDLSLAIANRFTGLNERNAVRLANIFEDIVDGDMRAATKAIGYIRCLVDCGCLNNECWIGDYATEEEFLIEHVECLMDIETKSERRKFVIEMSKLIKNG